MNATGLLFFFLFAMQIQQTSSQDAQPNKELIQETGEGAPLTEEEFATALLLKHELEEASKKADVSGRFNKDLFEGDIVNPEFDALNIRNFVANEGTNAKQRGVFRNALRSQQKLWPNGRIPYTISLLFSPYGRLVIASAIADFNAKTCIKFVPKESSDVDYVEMSPWGGCSSYVGRYGGKQELDLGERAGCATKGTAIHEMMHTIGFRHEQTDRDDYVKINWKNMIPVFKYAFAKYSLEEITHLGTPYDYGSIMHDTMYAASWNGLPTIEPLKKGVEIGQNRGFSENDIIKINRLYNCDMSATTTALPKPFRPCQDRLSNCAFMKTAGHCGSHYTKQFMQSNCPMTCNFCRDDNSAPCADETPLCKSWAASLSCAIPHLKEYMYSKCPSACNLC